MIKFELRNLSPLMLNSLTEENYLKALFALWKETDEVTVNERSKELGIKMPRVTSMMKKLAEKKLVNYQSYKPLRCQGNYFMSFLKLNRVCKYETGNSF